MKLTYYCIAFLIKTKHLYVLYLSHFYDLINYLKLLLRYCLKYYTDLPEIELKYHLNSHT